MYKKTSVLVEDGLPYCKCNQCDFEITAMKSLKLYKQDKHKIVKDGFPYYKCNQCDFEITAMKSLKLYKQDKHKIVSNINVTSVVMKPQFLRTNE